VLSETDKKEASLMNAQLVKEIFVRMEGNNINKLVEYC
jgi:hypothetical protein